jgi:acetolactate synthase-1/2/3 large subunit
MWSAQYFTFTRPRTFLTSADWARWVMVFPLRSARRWPSQRQVINIAGDASLQMNIQEWPPRHITICGQDIVMNNGGWNGAPRQDLFYGKNYSSTETTRLTRRGSEPDETGRLDERRLSPNYAKLAEATAAGDAR